MISCGVQHCVSVYPFLSSLVANLSLMASKSVAQPSFLKRLVGASGVRLTRRRDSILSLERGQTAVLRIASSSAGNGERVTSPCASKFHQRASTMQRHVSRKVDFDSPNNERKLITQQSSGDEMSLSGDSSFEEDEWSLEVMQRGAFMLLHVLQTMRKVVCVQCIGTIKDVC